MKWRIELSGEGAGLCPERFEVVEILSRLSLLVDRC